ncbi:MAG: hypothetical protein GY928_08415 [Colwellia sp.]|nr:hypothetical protein [Colwellia sp.]
MAYKELEYQLSSGYIYTKQSNYKTNSHYVYNNTLSGLFSKYIERDQITERDIPIVMRGCFQQMADRYTYIGLAHRVLERYIKFHKITALTFKEFLPVFDRVHELMHFAYGKYEKTYKKKRFIYKRTSSNWGAGQYFHSNSEGSDVYIFGVLYFLTPPQIQVIKSILRQKKRLEKLTTQHEALIKCQKLIQQAI